MFLVNGIGAGNDSWTGSCWANANDKGPNRGDIAIDESFGWGATGYLLPSIDDMMTGALTFATRVLEHETTHWGSQFLLGNHDDEQGNMLINIPLVGISFSKERGEAFEWQAFGNVGNIYDPATYSKSNPQQGWAVMEIYTNIQYTSTNDRSTMGPTEVEKRIHEILDSRADMFKLQKNPHP